MKSKKTKIILGTVITVFIFIIAAIFIYFFPMLLMVPCETGVVEGTEIIAVKNSMNDVYFIDTEDGYIMIDAGSDKDAILDGMRK